ncbi:hypothetical protein PG990_000397 [Apiospora arundinis]
MASHHARLTSVKSGRDGLSLCAGMGIWNSMPRTRLFWIPRWKCSALGSGVTIAGLASSPFVCGRLAVLLVKMWPNQPWIHCMKMLAGSGYSGQTSTSVASTSSIVF